MENLIIIFISIILGFSQGFFFRKKKQIKILKEKDHKIQSLENKIDILLTRRNYPSPENRNHFKNKDI